ncbi:hypothetical protein [Paludibacter jiangxiensis]|uniref:Glycosyl transferase family 2 n=1 Tax=Paludibacter jiangxiensis TaxID=681398 RepID=A0A170ZNL4_9BACT|nr:hypothetical protein [Paludibacter jiangxiensis]GAT62861.1 hypothetical protein PJIAN_3172 [Paludibacter jiangxiensis]
MARYTILMTACINPNGMPFTYLQDVNEREEQYIKAINHYLEHTNFDIVFCNNSGEDISDKIKTNTKRFEYLTFQGNSFDHHLGKGYGEMIILKYALSHSQFIKNSDYIIKITGRLIVSNLIQSIYTTNLIWLFKKNKLYFTDINRDSKLIDSRCFIANKYFFERSIINGYKLNDFKEYYFEHLLFDEVNSFNMRNNVCLFYPNLAFLGISGSTGVRYRPEKKTLLQKLSSFRDYCKVLKMEEGLSKPRYFYLSIISLFIRIVKIFVRRLS